MTAFDQAFQLIIGEEGGFTSNPADPGNWTGGVCGKGICRGTKYGIAASSHPDLDITNLTLERARTIYQDAYWTPVHADTLPKALSLLVFDAAVNCGVSRAIGWLQTAAGCTADGIFGQQTLQAVEQKSSDSTNLCCEFQAQRLTWMANLPTWHIFGLGWARRLCRLPYLSMTFGVA